MTKVTVSRKAHFNAAHRLYKKEWDEIKNEKIFGKCSNPFYHGHNYEIIVSITGEIDPQTGYVMDMKKLKDLIKIHVEDYFDHKNMNEQLPEFFQLNPTAENIVVVIWNKLRNVIDRKMRISITLFETPRNYVIYDGDS